MLDGHWAAKARQSAPYSRDGIVAYCALDRWLMKYREFVGARLLAMAVVVPAMFFIALGLEGSGWWLVVAIAYVPLCIAFVGYLNRHH